MLRTGYGGRIRTTQPAAQRSSRQCCHGWCGRMQLCSGPVTTLPQQRQRKDSQRYLGMLQVVRATLAMSSSSSSSSTSSSTSTSSSLLLDCTTITGSLIYPPTSPRSSCVVPTRRRACVPTQIVAVRAQPRLLVQVLYVCPEPGLANSSCFKGKLEKSAQRMDDDRTKCFMFVSQAVQQKPLLLWRALTRHCLTLTNGKSQTVSNHCSAPGTRRGSNKQTDRPKSRAVVSHPVDRKQTWSKPASNSEDLREHAATIPKPFKHSNIQTIVGMDGWMDGAQRSL